MKFAYADPPYIGQAKRLYQCAEIDHVELIQRLDREYDGWALSLTSNSLRDVLNMCPPGVRVGAWVKPFHAFKKNVVPSYGWEPVIFKTKAKWNPNTPIVRDFVVCNILLKKGFPGAKPKEFSFWIFELLGMTPQDEFADLFFGSGAVTEAHKEWCATHPEVLYRNLKPAARPRFEKGKIA